MAAKLDKVQLVEALTISEALKDTEEANKILAELAELRRDCVKRANRFVELVTKV